MANKEYDLILSDYQMDDGDGIELAKFLNESDISTPLIILTGFATKEIAIKAVQLGLYAFLEKQCAPSEIYKAVELGIDFGKNKKRHLNFSSMGEISSILMHEIVDPLNRSLSRVELIESRLAKNVSNIEYFQELKEDLDYISRLIANVRVQLRNTKDVYLKKFPVLHFVEVIETLQPELEIKYYSHLLENLFIRSDVVLFNQVIENLRKNAAEAMLNGEVSKAKLQIFKKDEGIVIEFENNSPEIPPSMRTRIFEAFVSTKKDSQSNLGIGLYFCNKVLKSHGGTITVKDSMPTTFVMTIPLV